MAINIIKWFASLFRKAQAPEAETPTETKLTLRDVSTELSIIAIDLDNLLWYITQEKGQFLNEQTYLFIEKLQFALSSLQSNIGFASDRERTKAKADQLKALIRETTTEAAAESIVAQIEGETK